MRVMLLGAGGFIGRHILSALAAGHEVVAVVRSSSGLERLFPDVRFVTVDLAQATDEAAWRDRLAGVACIVNAAGLLRGPYMEAVHIAMPRALYAAARAAGVRQAILMSAISARPDVPTDYARTKLAGEAVLRESGLDWTILRPSLVYGDGSYGGTSLLRGMAGFPFAIPLPGAGDQAFTPIHVEDLARDVVRLCGDAAFAGRALEPVGPATIDLRWLLQCYRAWLGFGEARFVSVPMPIMRALGRIGDFTGDGPVSSNSLSQLVAGNAGDSAAYAEAIGTKPRRLEDALRAHPADVQDRWHARLFFLAPATRAALIFLWLASAWLGLVYGETATREVVKGLGLSPALDDPLRIGASLADVGIATLLLSGRSIRLATIIQIAAILGYSIVIGLALPRLWLDPLGPLLKNLPILLLVAVYGVIGEKK
ncbi:SDR family oxidoreductase [Sphingopyxis indica]|uniref:Nucleoside-diphosphate-sugar epimerase n=1 Tax=Sphingopyxis indica TaxID=436663 RepID=A0A239HV24_9SPHN|nr:SDR family oxidoreductase [Sphingopyxis indica]SNS85206.1 Nucleoside-diphosphate-sugar epimerase [Sphingopyxis indica]